MSNIWRFTESCLFVSEIDVLLKQRKQLYNRFCSEQLAFKEQLLQHSEEERLRRDEYRATREARRKIRLVDCVTCMQHVYNMHATCIQHAAYNMHATCIQHACNMPAA